MANDDVPANQHGHQAAENHAGDSVGSGTDVDLHSDEPMLARSLKPVLLLAPLTVLLIVPALVYGWFSSQASAEAFKLVEQSLSTDAEGTTIDPSGYCQGVDLSEVRFYQLAENVSEARASLSNVGFAAATVDFKGWLEQQPEPATTGDSDSSTQQDLRDDVTFSLSRPDGQWCIDAITVRTSSDDEDAS